MERLADSMRAHIFEHNVCSHWRSRPSMATAAPQFFPGESGGHPHDVVGEVCPRRGPEGFAAVVLRLRRLPPPRVQETLQDMQSFGEGAESLHEQAP